jgi:diacylglycerol kinase (ATP)
MSAQGPQGFDRIIKATFFSISGLKLTFKNEAAFRQELFMAAILFPIGLLVGETVFEKALLSVVLFIVLIVELLNTCVEAAIDRFGGERHELSRYAKDAGSAAVFVSLVNVIVIWGLVLFF